MEVFVSLSHRQDLLADLPLAELARFVVEAENMPATSEVSLSFVPDEEIAHLNATYRGKEGPTDVLSFECDGLDDDFAAHVGEAFELGDVVVAPDVAMRQTELYGTSFEGEITLLVVHGLLHLCGYDHVDDDEAEAMEARERELLGRWADAGHEQVRHVRDDTIRVRGKH